MNRFELTASGSLKLLKKSAFIGTVLIAASILLSIVVEWISRGSLTETLRWLGGNMPIFALNALIGFSAVVLIYSLIGSLFLSIAASGVLLSVIAFINYYKSKLVGEPFFPWDIILKKEGMDVGPLFTGAGDLLKMLLIAAGLGFFIFLHVKLRKRLSVSWISRIVMGVVSVTVLFSFGLQVSWAKEKVVKAGVDDAIWSQQVNYDSNGLLLAFTLNVQHAIVNEPESYNEASMSGIADGIQSSRQDAVPAFSQTEKPAAKKKPNVIFIMSEAFWDPTLLSQVSFSSDPVPTVHKLQKERPSGYMLSPQFGGGTSNVEFEILTGLSMSFLPSGSVPYLQYVNRPVPSLASYFESEGYRSLGIHSYEGWFWNREGVYRELGFEGFKSKDGFFQPEYNGPYIADDEVVRSIIHEVDQTEEPVFIYAVTMQNHAPYTDEARYGEGGNTIQVEGDLTDEAKSMLETYSQGAYYADQSLRKLIEHYEQSDEPTYIIFYGDHLPTLGLEYDLYRQAGFVSSGNPDDWSLEEYKKLRSIPYVTWSNFPVEEEKVDTISSSFLGSYVMNALSMEPKGQFALHSSIYRNTPGLIRNLVVDRSNNLSHSMPAGQENILEQYRLLQYDILFGEQYLAKKVDNGFLTKAALPQYNTLAAEEVPEE
jgi:phosphoglycerol transferase MdoB-like AlkP superfamily enzyme